MSFAAAVLVYGGSMLYSILLWRRGFREDDRVLYGLLAFGAALHTVAMFLRGFSLSRCPINNLYEATIFVAWTIVASYLAIGWIQRLRFLGAFASPLLFGVGVFALMPALDVRGASPEFAHGWESLHAALVLLAYGDGFRNALNAGFAGAFGDGVAVTMMGQTSKQAGGERAGKRTARRIAARSSDRRGARSGFRALERTRGTCKCRLSGTQRPPATEGNSSQPDG